MTTGLQAPSGFSLYGGDYSAPVEDYGTYYGLSYPSGGNVYDPSWDINYGSGLQVSDPGLGNYYDPYSGGINWDNYWNAFTTQNQDLSGLGLDAPASSGSGDWWSADYVPQSTGDGTTSGSGSTSGLSALLGGIKNMFSTATSGSSSTLGNMLAGMGQDPLMALGSIVAMAGALKQGDAQEERRNAVIQNFRQGSGSPTQMNPVTVRQLPNQRSTQDLLAPSMFARGGLAVLGDTGGQDDMIDARLSDGEYVIPADVVAHLGDGNSNAGGSALDQFVRRIRQQKTGNGNFPKKANNVESYLKG